jgi:hypothetical protein
LDSGQSIARFVANSESRRGFHKLTYGTAHGGTIVHN